MTKGIGLGTLPRVFTARKYLFVGESWQLNVEMGLLPCQGTGKADCSEANGSGDPTHPREASVRSDALLAVSVATDRHDEVETLMSARDPMPERDAVPVRNPNEGRDALLANSGAPVELPTAAREPLA